MTPVRIHIVGAPGSGKTWLGKKLAAQLGVALTELDDLYWDNSGDNYGIKRAEDEREQLLAKVLRQPAWVIEGVYYKWLDTSFAAADQIIILQPPEWLRHWRLLRRYIRDNNSRQKSWKSFIELVKWGNDYTRNTLPRIIQLTDPHSNKRLILNSTKPGDFSPGLVQTN